MFFLFPFIQKRNCVKDLLNKSYSGLTKSREILKDLKEIKVIEFDHNDVVRHPLVSKIIRAYQKKSIDDKN